MQYHNLFPTTVGMVDIERELTDKEMKFILGQERRPNMGNTTSVDNFVLKQKALKDLNSFLTQSVNKYFDELYKPNTEVSLYITQSWINYTEPGQFHHKHAHPNSFVSGVFYIDSDNSKDRIYFYKDSYEQLKVMPREWNLFNSESWWFEANKGRLVMFPSSLTHMVQTVEADKTRISLSFNTFLKGNFGDTNSLTGITL